MIIRIPVTFRKTVHLVLFVLSVIFVKTFLIFIQSIIQKIDVWDILAQLYIELTLLFCQLFQERGEKRCTLPCAYFKVIVFLAVLSNILVRIAATSLLTMLLSGLNVPKASLPIKTPAR